MTVEKGQILLARQLPSVEHPIKEQIVIPKAPRQALGLRALSTPIACTRGAQAQLTIRPSISTG